MSAVQITSSPGHFHALRWRASLAAVLARREGDLSRIETISRRAGGRCRAVMSSLLAALLAATALGGCGASDPLDARLSVRGHSPPAAHPRTLGQALGAALLSPDVLGPGWSVERSVPIRCPAIDPWRGATLKRISPLLQQRSVAVQETIAELPTPALARAVGRKLASRPAQACFERALKANIATREGYKKFGSMVPVRGEPGAQRSTIRAQAQYGTVLTCIDEIRVAVGPLIADTAFISGPEPIDESLYERLLALVTRRVRDAARALRGTGDGGRAA